MDQLLGKLTNLSYEIFAIFLPGFVLFLFLGWWWWCVAALAPIISLGYLPILGMKSVANGYGLIADEIKLGLVIYVTVASYFLGHLINWLARSGGAKESLSKSKFKRATYHIEQCLLFSIPKKWESYPPQLQGLMNRGASFLGMAGGKENWLSFFPVAKSRIAQEVSQSLVVTYQNKYTLHRSLALASAIWFWLSFALVFLALVAEPLTGASPNWVPLFCSLPLSLMAAWGFSESYMFHWENFGKAVITEIFMLSQRERNDRIG